MSWTYSGDPSASDVDEARFLIGDTDENDPMMQDEEILYLISYAAGDANTLRYTLFQRAATLFARDIKKSLGPESQDPTERLKFFKDQTAYYKGQLDKAHAGLSIPNWQADKYVWIGMMDNPPVPDPSGE